MSFRARVDIPTREPATPAGQFTTPNQESIPTGYRRTFQAVFDFPAFRRLWLATLAASLGQWMQSTALGWLAFDLADSKSFVGIVTFVAGLPFLLISIPGGALIDRFDRRKVLMACQGAAAMLAIMVSVDVIAGWVQPWHLLVAGFCNGSLQAVMNPTQQSLVPGLVPRASLTNAVGLMSAGSNMTRVFGPSLAGAIIGFIGTGEAFLIQAVALIAAFALLLTTRFPNAPVRVAGAGMRGVLDGIRLVGSREDLRGLFLLAAIPSFLVFPYLSFMSVFAKDVLEIGPQGLGLLMASSGAGAVAGGLMVASSRQDTGVGKWLLGGSVLYSVAIAGFAVANAVWLSVPMLVLAGLLGSHFMSSNNALIQHRISDDVRGRVMGAYMLTWGLMPLGALPLGFIADRVGVQAATAGGAAVSAALTLVLAYRNRAIVQL